MLDVLKWYNFKSEEQRDSNKMKKPKMNENRCLTSVPNTLAEIQTRVTIYNNLEPTERIGKRGTESTQ